jgi:hypothetical protein
MNIINIPFEPKRQHSVQASRLVHEHLGTIMAFACSRRPLQQLVKANYLGEWKYLHKALFEIAEEKATRALMELGLYVRAIDDDESFTALRGDMPFGEVIDANGSKTPLRAREIANKIIHAERYDWSTCSESEPAVICLAGKDQAVRFKWASASISLIALGGLCGGLMS